MKASAVVGLMLCLMTLVIAGLPLFTTLTSERERAPAAYAGQAGTPGIDRSTVREAFDAEAARLGLGRSEKAR